MHLPWRPGDADSRDQLGQLPLRSPHAYCPRSSLPADVLAWLTARCAHLRPRPPGTGGRTPLPLESVWTPWPRSCSTGCRIAGRSDGRDLQDRGRRQHGPAARRARHARTLPAGRNVHHQPRRAARAAGEMAATGEPVLVDGLATRVQRPRDWGNQKVLYDTKRHLHTARVCRSRPSTATCCGATAAGPAAATSTSCWCCRAHRAAGRHRGRRADRPRVPRAGAGSRALARPSRRPAHQGPAHVRAARVQPAPCRAARAGRAVDQPPGQRVGAAPLAWAALPRPRRVPRCCGADLPRPMAPPRTRVRSITDTLNGARLTSRNPPGPPRRGMVTVTP